MKHSIFISLFKLLLVLFVFTSLTNCTSFSRGMGNLSDNKYSKARSGSKWIIAPPQLEPLAAEQKTVYISFNNISDASSIDLEQLMVDEAKSQGWTIETDPNKANFRVRASLRYFGEVEIESGGVNQASQYGDITGAAVGYGAGPPVNPSGSVVAEVVADIVTEIGLDNADSLGEAIVVIGAAAIIGSAIANASEPREWAMIIDILLEEYNEEGFEFEIATASEDSNISRNSVGSQRDILGNESGNTVNDGAQTQSLTKSAYITKKSNYFPYGTRLSVWTNQMNMRENEALPELKKRIENVMGSLLPE